MIAGACYTFNFGEPYGGSSLFTSYRAGPTYGILRYYLKMMHAADSLCSSPAEPYRDVLDVLSGLRMILVSNQSEYLPFIESAGARIAVHDPAVEPFPDAFGYNAATGFTTSFAVNLVHSGFCSGSCSKKLDLLH